MSQVRQFFLLSNVFRTINHVGIRQLESVVLSIDLFPYVNYYLIYIRVYSSQRSSLLINTIVHSVQEHTVFTIQYMI